MTPAEWLAVANTVAVFALAIITGWYAWSTARMLAQLRRQAEASQKQADLAERTLQHLLQVAEEQRGVAETVVDTTIAAALANVAHWQSVNILSLAVRHALAGVNLVPDSGRRAVEHARLVAPLTVAPLNRGLSILERCEGEFRILNDVTRIPGSDKGRHLQRIQEFLQEANGQLSLAQQILHRGGNEPADEEAHDPSGGAGG